jgi:hypothetical protein
MSRTRWSWVVVGGIATLLFVAGVDAFRSSDTESAAPPTRAATTVVEAPDTGLPPCSGRQVAVSIEVLKGVAVMLVRHMGFAPCHQEDLDVRLTIRDRARNQVRFVPGRPAFLDLEGDLRAGRGQILPFPVVRRCPRRGPFVAFAILGRAGLNPHSAIRGNLSRSQIGCDGGGEAQESVKRLRAEYVAQAEAICRAATIRSRADEAEATRGRELTELQVQAASSKAAARAAERALRQLRALPPPEVDRARVRQVLSFMELQTDVVRQLAVAASTGDITRVEMLSDEGVHLVHRKDGLVFGLASLWDVAPAALYGCPLKMPG